MINHQQTVSRDLRSRVSKHIERMIFASKSEGSTDADSCVLGSEKTLYAGTVYLGIYPAARKSCVLACRAKLLEFINIPENPCSPNHIENEYIVSM